MIVSGIPKEIGNRHASEISRLALAFMRKIRQLRDESTLFPRIFPRIGIQSGSAVGGVVGSKMPRFCLYGETVNLASQFEAESDPGRIQIGYNTKTLLELTEFGNYTIMQRGSIKIKGIGWSISRTFHFPARMREMKSNFPREMYRKFSSISPGLYSIS